MTEVRGSALKPKPGSESPLGNRDRGEHPTHASTAARPGDEKVFDDFDRDHYSGWVVSGPAFGDRPTRTGDFRLDLAGGAVRARSALPGQAHSGLISDRLSGVMRSRSFTIESRYIHWLVAGRGCRINVVVDGFEKIRDPIYGELTRRIEVGDEPRWITQDLGMWLGHSAYLEISDGGTVDFSGPNALPEKGQGYIAVDEIRISNHPTPLPSQAQATAGTPRVVDLAILADELQKSGRSRLADQLATAIALAREIEGRLGEPTTALAVIDGTGENEHIHIRGSHRNLGEVVPRRFLTVLGGTDLSPGISGSGRLELAQRMVDPAANPLLARVLVNRVWKHHFGEGIVKSTDDFGAMGQKPSHPELLDWLAAEFVGQGWSIKALHRLMVTSNTYQMTSLPQGDAERIDPTNTLLHRMNVRRLEAEAIRDSLLAVSGELVSQLFWAPPCRSISRASWRDAVGRGVPDRSMAPGGEVFI